MANIGTLAGRLEMDVSPWEKAARQVQSQAKGLGDTIGRVVEQAAGFAAGQAGFLAFGQGIGAAQQAVFGMNSTLETATLQFETLMGSAAAAKAQVADIFEIAKKTPFETGPILAASKSLQTFGGAALNTKSQLIAIGDAAAASGAPINELAFWVGRAYSMIQGGQPFGEAAMRLQELAILTPQARQQMEALQKSGASSAEVWKVLQGELGRFNGAMEKQAGTWQGLTSTFSDSANILMSKVFQPLFKVAEQTLGRINEFLDTPEVEVWANTMSVHVEMVIRALGVLGSVFGKTFSAIANIVMTVGQIVYKGMQWINPFASHSDPLVTQVEDGLDLIMRKYADLAEIEGPLRTVEGLVTNFEAVSAGAMARIAQATLDEKMVTLSYLGGDIPQAYGRAIGTIQSLNVVLGDLRSQIADQRMVVQDWKEQVDAATAAVKEQQRIVRDAERELRPYQQAVNEARAELQPFSDATKEAKDELQAIKDQIADTTATLRPYQLAVDAANRALQTQAMNVETARLAMQPFKDAVDSAQDSVSRVSEQLSLVKDKISDLQRVPLAGSEKFRKQLEATTDQANKIKLQIAQMGIAGVRSGPQIEALRQQLDKLDATAESIRLQEAVQLDPQRRQIAQAINPTPAEQPFSALLEQAKALGSQKSTIETTLDSVKAGLTAAKDAQRPYADALKAEESIQSKLTAARDKANLELQRQKDILTPLIDLQAAAEEKVRLAEQAERPYAQALEAANREFQTRKDAMQPLLDQLQDLRDVQSDLQEAQQADLDRLKELEGAYGAVSNLAKDWADRLDAVAAAAEKAEEKAKAAAKIKAPGEMAANLGFDPEALAARQAEMEAKAEEMAKIADQVEAQWAPVFETLERFNAKMDDVNKNVSDFMKGLSESGPAVKGMIGQLQTMSPLVWGIAGGLAAWALLSLGSSIGGIIGPLLAFTAQLSALSLAEIAAAVAAGTLDLALLPIIVTVGAIALAVGLLALAWQTNFLDIQGRTEEFKVYLGYFGELFGKTFETFGTNLNNFGLLGKKMWKDAGETMAVYGQAAKEVMEHVGGFFDNLGTKVSGFMTLLGTWKDSFLENAGIIKEGIGALFGGIGTTIGNIFSGIGTTAFGFFRAVAIKINEMITWINGLPEVTIGDKTIGFPKIPLLPQSAAPTFAQGTNNAPGGLALVGEQGPELVNLPRGSQVIPNDELGGTQITIHVHPRPGDSEESIARRVADIIEQRQSRTTRSRMLGSGTSFS